MVLLYAITKITIKIHMWYWTYVVLIFLLNKKVLLPHTFVLSKVLNCSYLWQKLFHAAILGSFFELFSFPKLKTPWCLLLLLQKCMFYLAPYHSRQVQWNLELLKTVTNLLLLFAVGGNCLLIFLSVNSMKIKIDRNNF